MLYLMPELSITRSFAPRKRSLPETLSRPSGNATFFAAV